MKTPKYMIEAIQNKVITEEILGACTYSCNKRAKNCRDKEQEYRTQFDYYGNGRKNRLKKDNYYHMKDTFLSLVTPVCVHTAIESRDFYDGRDYIGVYKVKRFYLYYKVGEYGFHQPIKEKEIPADLPREDIGEFTTYGKNIKDLLSTDYCKKVLALIESGDYQYIPQQPLKEAQTVNERDLYISL